MTSVPSRACGLLLCALAATLVSAATTTYEYDALGRLRVVTHDNRIATTYTLDPAGNRTHVTDIPVGPTSAPASISVPSVSDSGDYSVSWGAATGTVLTYELYESTDPSFSGATRVHNAASRTATFVGKPNRTTYYYRVRACANADCSGFATGANGVSVNILPPGAPPAISVPSSSSTGGYTITWSPASGLVQTYELYESTSPTFGTSTLVRSDAVTSMAFAGKAHGSTYYYRVRACGRGGCGDFTPGANGVTTMIPPPSTPASIWVPGLAPWNYAVTWGESTGYLSTYELYESTTPSFAPQTLKYSGSERVALVRDMPNGIYFYRVRGCGVGGCSDFMTGANGVVVNRAPPSPEMPTHLTKTHVANCAWRATWGAVSDAANYVVSDTMGNEQTVNTLYASVVCPLNNQFANQPRWVKACSSAGFCSSKAYFP